MNPAGADLEDEEHVDPVQQNGVDGEEVTRQHRPRLGPAELSPRRPGPSRRRIHTCPVQDVSHRRTRQLVPEADELASEAERGV
jgi:hypothetical protein